MASIITQVDSKIKLEVIITKFTQVFIVELIIII